MAKVYYLNWDEGQEEALRLFMTSTLSLQTPNEINKMLYRKIGNTSLNDLNAIFSYYNSNNKVCKDRSMSVGDVIELREKNGSKVCYIVLPSGFKDVQFV